VGTLWCGVIVDVGYEGEHHQQSEWDGWQNAGWGVSNWTVPPPPPPSDSHVGFHRQVYISVCRCNCSSDKFQHTVSMSIRCPFSLELIQSINQFILHKAAQSLK